MAPSIIAPDLLAIRFLTQEKCAFTASRRPTALNVVLQEVEDHHGVASLPHIICRMTEVENWPDLESAVRAAMNVFLHPQDRFTHHSDKKQLFDASFLRHSSDAFPMTADEDQEVVTVIVSPAITMSVSRKVRRRDDPLRFQLTFQDPVEGVGAVLRYKEFDRSGPRSVIIEHLKFEPALTITAKFRDHTVMSRAAVELLGEHRLKKPPYDPFRHYDTATVVPAKDETLVVYDSNPSYALGLTTTHEERQLRHPNEAAFASIVDPDGGGGITFFYRPPPPPERGGGRGYARVDAFVDAALPIVPKPQRVPGGEDDDYEDYEPRSTPTWRDEY